MTARPRDTQNHAAQPIVANVDDQIMTFVYQSEGVYRTDNRDLFLVISAHLLEDADERENSNNTGFFVCPIIYDLELRFGTDGKAITRAVSFGVDKRDITDEVITGGFLKMELVASQSTLADETNDPGEAEDDIVGVAAEPKCIFLPRRRYTYTERVANNVFSESNLPEHTSTGVNYIAETLQERAAVMRGHAVGGVNPYEGVQLELGFGNPGRMLGFAHSGPSGPANEEEKFVLNGGQNAMMDTRRVTSPY